LRGADQGGIVGIPNWRLRRWTAWDHAAYLDSKPDWVFVFGSYRQILATEPDNLEAKIGLSEVLYWTGNSEAAAATLKGVPEDKLDDKGKLMLADLFVAKKPKLSPWGYAARIDANRQILTERYSSFL